MTDCNLLSETLSFISIDCLTRDTDNFKRLRKDPSVDTSFLPDAERIAWELKTKSELATLWSAKQVELKEEKLGIHCVFWDGSTHDKYIEVKRGMTIGGLLDRAREEWDEIRGLSLDHLMFVRGIDER
jgi:protein FAM50